MRASAVTSSVRSYAGYVFRYHRWSIFYWGQFISVFYKINVYLIKLVCIEKIKGACCMSMEMCAFEKLF